MFLVVDFVFFGGSFRLIYSLWQYYPFILHFISWNSQIKVTPIILAYQKIVALWKCTSSYLIHLKRSSLSVDDGHRFVHLVCRRDMFLLYTSTLDVLSEELSFTVSSFKKSKFFISWDDSSSRKGSLLLSVVLFNNTGINKLRHDFCFSRLLFKVPSQIVWYVPLPWSSWQSSDTWLTSPSFRTSFLFFGIMFIWE